MPHKYVCEYVFLVTLQCALILWYNVHILIHCVDRKTTCTECDDMLG